MLQPWKASLICGLALSIALVVQDAIARELLAIELTSDKGASVTTILFHAVVNGLLVACTVRTGLYAARCHRPTWAATTTISTILFVSVVLFGIISGAVLAQFVASLHSSSVVSTQPQYEIPMLWLMVSGVVAFLVGIAMKGRVGAA